MKRHSRWIVVFMLLFQSYLFAGSISGRVVNGTQGHTVPDTLMVALNVYLPDGQVKTLPETVPLKADGQFYFDNLEENAQYTYEPMVIYRGIKYYGKPVRLSPEDASATTEVTIYETTRSDTALQVVRHHVLFAPGEGSVAVKEMVFLENRGDRTYIGKEKAPSGKYRTVSYRLPPGAKSIELGEGTMTCCIEFDENGFYDTMEIPPGKKQVIFSYLLDSDGEQLLFRKPITVKTAEIDFISFDPAVQITGEGLVEKPLPNNKFKRQVLTNLQPGQTATVTLAGLPAAPHDLSLIFFAGFLAVFVVGGVIAYRRIQRNVAQQSNRVMATEKTTHVDHTVLKEKLLREIALLDEAYESQRIGEDEYQVKRNLLLEELKHIVNSR
ncbi:MAG: hypothetical protein GXO78_04535 [Calditrichaeota bacterium]|nr:hypothetical protein [Calditrichota bacterium]